MIDGGQPWWETLLIVFFFVTFVAAMISQVLRQKDRGMTLDNDLGSEGGWGVDQVSDEKGRDFVAVGTWMGSEEKYQAVRLTASHARLLADMLRLAAQPGYNLKQARLNHRKAAWATVATPPPENPLPDEPVLPR